MPTSSTWGGCRLCGSRLVVNRRFREHVDDLHRGVCAECHDRPEAKRFGVVTGRPTSMPARAPSSPPTPRAFTQAERALIKNLHSHMPTAQLLDVLNARASADRDHVPFTMEQIADEITRARELSAHDGEWASLRKVIAAARTSGVLNAITAHVVDDFAVVFRLSPAQHMHLRDVIKNAQGER
jgi:hypothetical protein